MLEIKNLHAKTEGQDILKGLTLTVKPGEVHAIMGRNGAGKSTLAKVLAGHPSYEVTQGEATLDGENLLEMDPSERSHLGLFMSFQYPLEIEGVSNREFLEAINKKGTNIEQVLEKLQMSSSFLDRDLNSGFSGGEKKRDEILQMAVLDPKVAILDETDSGLDVDALKVVGAGINALMNENKAVILITHYQRLLDYVKPDFVHIMMDGKIVKSGDYTLALELEKNGYEALCV